MSGRTFVALLRGINLGRHKRIAMADLRKLLEGLGYEDVRTLLQSGNAVFTTTGQPATVEGAIADQIDAELGMDVKVLVRAAAEITKVVDENPFARKSVDRKELHAAFLSAKPAAGKLKALDPVAYEPDEFEVGDRVIYMRRPNGIMGTRLPDWQKALGVDVTERNWNTVSRLHDLVGG